MSKLLDIRKRIRQKKKVDEYSRPIEIRDSREKEFFIVDDKYFNGFARLCGVHATIVYLALCRHAGKDQTCFPAVVYIADKTGLGTKSIIRGLKTLEAHNIIKIDRKKGEPNIYTLTNKKHWRKEPKVAILSEAKKDAMTEVWDNGMKKGLI